MHLSSHSYPHHQEYLIELLKNQLDKVFYDVYPVSRPILLPQSILTETNVSANSLKEVFHLEEGGILRFDHTHVSFKYKNSTLNERNYGNVFRREPRSANRWREFFQYDVDYSYTDHGIRPLVKLLSFLGPGFTVTINDLSLMETHKTVTDQEYMIKLMGDYPLLKNLPISIDRSFIRGWGYYTGLIFEVCRGDSLALTGGGVYKDSTMFGFGIGVNRILNLAMSQVTLLDRLLPSTPIVWVRYTESIPSKLLDQLEQVNLNYHLSKVVKPLFKEYKKINSQLLIIRKKITSIITVSDKEELDQTYGYIDKQKTSWVLSELIPRFLERAWG